MHFLRGTRVAHSQSMFRLICDRWQRPVPLYSRPPSLCTPLPVAVLTAAPVQHPDGAGHRLRSSSRGGTSMRLAIRGQLAVQSTGPPTDGSRHQTGPAWSRGPTGGVWTGSLPPADPRSFVAHMETWATGARSNREAGPLCEAREGVDTSSHWMRWRLGYWPRGFQLCSP